MLDSLNLKVRRFLCRVLGHKMEKLEFDGVTCLRCPRCGHVSDIHAYMWIQFAKARAEMAEEMARCLFEG